MSQEPIEVRLKRIDEEREKIQNKMQELSTDLMVFPENYQQLSQEIRILLQEAKDLEENSSATPEQANKIHETIKNLQEQDRICNAKASKVEEEKSEGLSVVIKDGIAYAPQPAATGKLTPQEGIAEMQRLLDEAKNSPDRKLISDNQNKVMNITSRVPMVDQKSDYITKLVSVLKEFKSLTSAAAANAGETKGAANQTSAYIVPLVQDRVEKTANQAQAGDTVPQADDLGLDKSGMATPPTIAVGETVVDAKVDESALPATGIDKAGLKAQLQEIATENKWGISFPENTIKIEDKNQSISIQASKQGMKITGSAELGSNVLDKWCDKNKFDKLDVKVSMPTVAKNIDSKSPEGDAAWKAFSTYNEKGFYVKDFPIDNFKDKPNYQQMKQQYEGIKEQVAAKQMSSPKMTG